MPTKDPRGFAERRPWLFVVGLLAVTVALCLAVRGTASWIASLQIDRSR